MICQRVDNLSTMSIWSGARRIVEHVVPTSRCNMMLFEKGLCQLDVHHNDTVGCQKLASGVHTRDEHGQPGAKDPVRAKKHEQHSSADMITILTQRYPKLETPETPLDQDLACDTHNVTPHHFCSKTFDEKLQARAPRNLTMFCYPK
jgi:hypothetical protein